MACFGRLDEVADGAFFLASGAASFVAKEGTEVDGGYMAHRANQEAGRQPS